MSSQATVHLTENGKLKCNQKSFYPLTTTEDKERVTCQYCIQGPKLGKKIKKYASGPMIDWRK